MVKIISTSDWHLGHNRLNPLTVTDTIRILFFERLKTTDIFVIGGDIFHSSLYINDTWARQITSLFIDFFEEAAKYPVRIYLLRGTFTHDRKQIEWLMKLNKNAKVTYIDSIKIIRDELSQLDLLFIPDNLPYKTSDDALCVIKEQMQLSQIETIDYVFCHGYFDYILPVEKKHHEGCIFRHEQFKDIVTSYICCGHVHVFSRYKNIVYNNSLERLTHRDEADKGFVEIEHTDKDNQKLTYVINPFTTLFISLDLSSYDTVDSTLIQVKKKIKDKIEILTNKISYVHIRHQSPIIRAAILSYFEATFPLVVLSSDTGANLVNQQIKPISSIKTLGQRLLPLTEETLSSRVYELAVVNKKSRLCSKEYVDKLLSDIIAVD